MALKKAKKTPKIIVEFYGRAGIVALAKQIASYIPTHFPTPGASKLSVPKIHFKGKVKYINPMVVDTSALIDGRLVEVAKTGFLYGALLVIPAVVAELHQLADSGDVIKRVRGRRGLDLLAELALAKKIKVEMVPKDPEGAGVDRQLVAFARKNRAKLVTVDFNLNKVAKVSKVIVLNLNELANAVRTAVLPHDRFNLLITDRGKGRQQGVGYLADGTMVVVEGAAGAVGKHVDVAVLKVLQTAAGKMIFARLQAPER